MKTKLFTLFLALAVSVGTMFAEVYSGTCGENLTWELSTETGLLTITGTGEMTDWVNSSDVPWISYASSIKEVSLPEGLTTIGGMAFLWCSKLTSITIPSSVININSTAFMENSIESIIVEDTNITFSSKDGVLYNKEQTILLKYPIEKADIEFEIPNTVIAIEYDAFNDCRNIESIFIPSSVTDIRFEPFRNGRNLKSINVDNSNEIYSSVDGVLYNKEQTILYACPSAKSGNYSIPLGVTSIETVAFYNGSLSSITMPNTVTSIGEQAFAFCYDLTSVTLSESLAVISPRAFYQSSSLSSITIPNSVETISEQAFWNTGLTSVTIPKNVSVIGTRAFDCNYIESINVDKENTSFCSIDGVLYSKDTTVIYQYPKGKNGEEYELPVKVKTIGESAFYFSSLKRIIISSEVTTINEDAFSICSNLKEITCYAEVPPIVNGRNFIYVSKTASTIYVPWESIDLYREANQWNEFVNIVPIPGTIIEDIDINYLNKTGGTIDSESISLTLPAVPEIDGFTFLKWKVVESDLADGINIQAIYTANTPTSAPAMYTNPANPAQKLIRNGNVYILTEDKTYTVTGQEVK